MGSDQCFQRLNTLEIKALIYQKIGYQRADTYFGQLGNFLTSRISKSEFDKLCSKTVGRENISLHNRLVRSILKNASVAKSPPPRYPKKSGNANQSQSLYGDSAFPPSPRKCRSRKFRDRPSPLGPLGKPQSLTTTNDESMSKAQRLPMEVVSVEDGEEVEQMTGSPSVQSRSPLTAPLGVSFHLKSRAKKSVFSSYNGINRDTCQNNGELPDTITLRARLERKLEMEGIKLSMDSANLLNSGLNAYMRRLIEPCLSLASSRVREMNSQQKRAVSNVSTLDFRAAMELNPRVLGEEWPIHLEKICCRASEE
ncbi:Transcriptional coactivator Hfi1/Transcriptional adapter 1 [Arabidopsis thaliana x Arabidopsis arenosa]|uniref:Transcriptional coactivator Hfi1/Transcriptional adapter 1 n=1 Tax=Arabidopsis thaliana x Arabidopsis arenosa TaxID=1240361 RepID=A0A8T2AY33_9BRAS|nr:Transcriptional coactivator Hfi1/Transcriptional adapter 1 [Arabidopsis thaliana x Arabidopsis arenosa]